jgi:hypothetical protein
MATVWVARPSLPSCSCTYTGTDSKCIYVALATQLYCYSFLLYHQYFTTIITINNNNHA